MADKEYIRSPQAIDFGKLPTGGFRYMQQIANRLNQILTTLNDMDVYADNAAAVAGGLSAGDIYATSSGELRRVV